MSIIEGVGDEVLYLFLVVFIIIALYVSWLSTSVSPSSFTYVVAIDNALFNNIFWRFTGTTAEAATANDSNPSPGNDSNPSPGNDPNGPDTRENQEVEPNRTSEVSEEATNDPAPQNDSVENENNGSSPSIDRSSPNASSEATREPVEKANESSPTETPTGHMRVRLQYIDGKQRTVFARPEETIGEFKRRNFSQEIGSQSVVRFIIGGRELKNESTSLRAYNVKQDDVVHCLVSNIRPAQRSSQSSSSSTGRQRGSLDVGALVFPIFGLALALVWYARIFHRGYFNGTSTFSLVAITFLYILSLLASYRVGSQNDAIGHLHQD